MKIAEKTKTLYFRAFVFACSFSLVPALVGADKSKAAPPAEQPAARPAQQAPGQKPVQRAPVQPPARKTPIQKPPQPPQAPTGAGKHPSNGGPAGGGITGNGGARPAGSGGITGHGGGGGITGNGGAKPTTGGGITGNGGHSGITGNGNNGRTPSTGIAGGSSVHGAYEPRSGMLSTNYPDGTHTYSDRQSGTKVKTDNGGRVARIETPGVTATNFRSDGHAGHIERVLNGNRMVVDRGVRGERRVELIRPGGVKVVTAGKQAFVERPLRPGYVTRTYVVDNRTYVRVYRSYAYLGIPYMAYVPAVYYQPAFYGWAVLPWGPVGYAWGWGPVEPWFFGAYFAPAAVYSTPALWLTDFVLAANLRLAYENQGQEPQQPDQGSQDTPMPLTPAVKMQIAEEVRQQLLAEQAAASQPAAAQSNSMAPQDNTAPPAMKERVFVVSASMDVTGIDDGRSCTLTAGDIIERTAGQPITGEGRVLVDVMNSKPGECPAEFATQLDLATLQDMQNQFRVQLTEGMKTLANNQGKSLPSAPVRPVTKPTDGQVPPNEGSNAEARDLVAKLNQEADQTEQEIRKAANGGQ